MKSAIEEIFDERLGKESPEPNKEYHDATYLTNQKATALLKLLKDNDEAIKAFGEYTDAQNECACVEAVCYYKSGFRHGFRVALDAMAEND